MQIYVRWFFERKQVKLTIIWNEKISRNKQILTLKKLYPELNKVSTVEIYKITKKRRNGNLQRWDGDLLLTFRIKQKKAGIKNIVRRITKNLANV